MIGNPTLYKNTFRTISGTTNLIFDSDVILLCDTSVGAVGLTLLEIPADRFSTQYKIYVVDVSNNASINNITITAPTGFTVNNSSVATINVNGGVGVITISSNTTYNAQFNFGGGGSGNPLIIKNEGTTITSSASSIDFVGANVNATAVGNDVTVTVQSGFEIVTYAQLQILISTNALIPSQQYLVTDAIFLFTSIVENASIIIEAVTTNEVTISGSGIFLNADYQKVGDYSGVSGFVAQMGVWSGANTYSIGEVVIWNNLHWLNLNGANTGTPNTTPSDWSQLAKTSTNGYITEIDIIKYDVSTNRITYREDIRNNCIENNFSSGGGGQECFRFFQWGNDGVKFNNVFSESYFQIWNNIGLVNGNSLKVSSFVQFPNGQNQGTFEDNSLEVSQVVVSSNVGTMVANLFFAIEITVETDDPNSTFSKNIFKFGSGHIFTNNSSSSTLEENTFISSGKSTFVLTNEKSFTKNNFIFCQFTIINRGNVEFNNFKNTDFDITNDADIIGNVFENIINASLVNTGDFTSNNIFNLSSSAIDNQSAFVANILNNTTLNILNLGKFNENNFDKATFNCPDNQGEINRNQISGNSTFTINSQNLGLIYYNVLKAESTVIVTSFLASSYFADNKFVSSSFNSGNASSLIKANVFIDADINIVGAVSSPFSQNQWIQTTLFFTLGLTTTIQLTNSYKASITATTFLYDVDGGICQNNCGTIIYSLDMLDATIYNPATFTLTIPNGISSFFGEYNLLNVGKGLLIRKIINSSPRYATKFTIDGNADYADFSCLNGVSTATANEIISIIPAPKVYSVYGRNNGRDSIYVRRLGNLNGVEQVYQYL
jgi:hypothetical protein